MSSDILLSVVICTYNRAELSKICLASVLGAMQSFDNVEVVVVDNNSKDATADTIQTAIAGKKNARYVFEPAQGLSHARNRGAAEARGHYVGYIDDECIVDAAWLEAALNVIRTHHPAVFGGPYGAWYQGEKPAWYKDEYASTTHKMSEARALKTDEFVSGGNLFVERQRIADLEGFDPNFGMAGTKISYGEETDFQIRLRAQDPSALIYFDPKVFLRHLVRPEKLNLSHIARLKFANGRISTQIFSSDKSRSVKVRLDAFLKCVALSGLITAGFVKGRLSRDKNQHPYFKNYFYEVIGANITRLGGHWERAVGVLTDQTESNDRDTRGNAPFPRHKSVTSTQWFQEYKDGRFLPASVEPELATMLNAAVSGQTVIDAGANVGRMSFIMGLRGAKVHAFEPNPVAFEELSRNVGDWPNITVHNAAVADKDGEASLYLHELHKENAVAYSSGSSLKAEKGNVLEDESVSVRTVDLARFIQELETPVFLLKMDIEGAEVDVIPHLINCGTFDHIEHAVVETHEKKNPPLVAATNDMRAKIKKAGLDAKVRLDWH